MNLAKLKAVIEADTRRFHTALKGVDVATERVFGGIRGRIQRLRKDFRDELGKGLSIGFGTAVASKGLELVGRGVQAVTDFIGTSINASRDLSETLSKSSVVFGQSAQDILAWGGTAATAFGMSKQAAIEAAASFGNVFIGLDIGQDKAATMSKRLVGLAGDLASFNNMDPAEALEKLSAGLAGESEPLRRVGVFMSEAKVKAKAMEMGLGNVHDELTEGQKILARYQLILDSTSTAQGDFARTSEGLANKQRTATASLIDAQAELGAAFEPIALQTTQWQIDFIEGTGLATDALLGFGRGIGDAVDALTPWDSATEVATKAADELAASLNMKATVDRIVGDFGRTAVASDRVTLKVGDLSDAALDLLKDFKYSSRLSTEAFSTMRDKIIGAASDIVGKAYDVLDARVALSAVNSQLAAAKKVLTSGTAKAAEIADAKDVLREVGRDQAELVLQLTAAGAGGSKTVADAIVDMKGRLRKATGLERVAILATLTALEQVETQANTTFRKLSSITSNTVLGGRGGIQHRAEGGPVSRGGLFKVGERGEEWFVPKTDGMILPHGMTPAMAAVEGRSAGDDGGATYNVTVNNPEPRAADTDIGRMLRRLEGLGLVGTRAWSGSGS